MKVQVIATLQCHPAHAADVVAQLQILQQHSRTEEGCLQYDLCTRTLPDKPDVTELLVVELWDSRLHLDAHLRTDHFKNFQDAVKPALMHESINVYTPLSA
jgi:quinol monooxygenase YgiN